MELTAEKNNKIDRPENRLCRVLNGGHNLTAGLAHVQLLAVRSNTMLPPPSPGRFILFPLPWMLFRFFLESPFCATDFAVPRSERERWERVGNAQGSN